jgi:hypothetical protein
VKLKYLERRRKKYMRAQRRKMRTRRRQWGKRYREEQRTGNRASREKNHNFSVTV